MEYTIYCNIHLLIIVMSSNILQGCRPALCAEASRVLEHKQKEIGMIYGVQTQSRIFRGSHGLKIKINELPC